MNDDAPPGATAPDQAPAPGSAPAGARIGPPAAAPGIPVTQVAPTEDIRDIRGPHAVLPAWVWPAVFGALVLLVLAAYAIRRHRRRARVPVPLLPHQEALQALEAARPLMQPATLRDFSGAVSDIVRRYIEVRFGATASRRTTEEFLHDLLATPDPVLLEHRALLDEFLHRCDVAKFADLSMSAQSMESLYHSARAFVQETIPVADCTATPGATGTARPGAAHATPGAPGDTTTARITPAAGAATATATAAAAATARDP